MEEIGAIDCVDVGEVEVVALGVCNMGFVVVADPFVVGMPALFDVAMDTSDIDEPVGATSVASSASGVACKRMHKGIAEGHVTSLFRGTSPLVNYPSTNRG